MDNASSTFGQSDFDWDAINVGDYQLDHSQNFFAARANKENNRSLSNVNPLLLCTTPQKIGREQRDGDFDGKLISAGDLKKESPKDTTEASKDALTIKPKVEPHDVPELKLKTELQELAQVSPLDNGPEPQDDIKQIVPLNWGKDGDDDEKHMTEADQHLVHQERPPGVGAKLRLEWSPPRHREHEGAGASATSAAPKAYQFKDVYESKRQQAMRKRSEEESKARQFHSRPMPNFKAMHKRMNELAVIHKITVPRTPETLKHSQSNVERRRDDDPADQARLHPAGTRSRPFHLRSEQRVRDRREFDAAVQVSLEQKKKEVKTKSSSP
uniref:Meiotic 38, isoform B n=1 Tax=Drosophila melanogaster TaxID=7227 RepID=X2JDV3_DROME|nr:meiotic 38, isoform B [Drosophila melanogaster]AHN59254.1 meiotic 38, isoform B [Drosophila melanogaster]|eukprot:NP_001284783.1 meiotic 38, isoform B [Drosophila melanogaster]